METEERSLVINIDNLPHCDTMDAKDLVNLDRSSIWTKHCYGEDLSIRVAGRNGAVIIRARISTIASSSISVPMGKCGFMSRTTVTACEKAT